MSETIKSIPTILKGILLGFATILMIYATYPVANHILGLMTDGTMMKYASILAYWLIIVFTTWGLPFIIMFKKNKEGTN